MKTKLLLLLAIVSCIGCSQNDNDTNNILNIQGEWQFAIDTADVGITEGWFNKNLDDMIALPGSTITAHKGEKPSLSTSWTGDIIDKSFFIDDEYAKYRADDNFKVPFWLQPDTYYKGLAWYSRKVKIPSRWKDQSIVLNLERCHWESRLWIDDVEVGMNNSLSTPHTYELTGLLTPGTHRITIRIDNRVKDIDPGINAHSISDHTQGNWNGIAGDISLTASPMTTFASIKIYPNIDNNSIKVKSVLKNRLPSEANVTVRYHVSGMDGIEESLRLKPGDTSIEHEIALDDDVVYWDEFTPELYLLQAELIDDDTQESQKIDQQFGMRSLTVEGNQMFINGRPLYLRGALDCGAFPLTGYPPTDKESWIKIYSECKKHGLNHLRYHSWCPPEAAFEAADIVGLYIEVECASWANQSTSLGDGRPLDDFIMAESKRIVESYGNHPSFCMMMACNEPGGRGHVKYLTDFVSYWKENDSRRLYSSSAGWPNLPVNDFLSDTKPRIQAWGQGLGSIINAEAPRTDYDWSDYCANLTQPVVSHEIGQWCVYPNFKEMSKYVGPYKAKNFEIFEETLQEHGMASLADSFLLASGRLQTLCYKADIEAALKTRGFSGFHLLGINDFPGQGTALVGVLDVFWEEKGYVTPEEYSRFCNSTVPLLEMAKCIYTDKETFKADLRIANYGQREIPNCSPRWVISDEAGTVIASGSFPTSDIVFGNDKNYGSISYPLNAIERPTRLTVEVAVDDFANSWNIWVYPTKRASLANEQSIKIVNDLDAATIEYLKEGGSVLLSFKKGSLPSEIGGDIPIGFSSIFWNTAWTAGQPPHTLGIICDPKHPALASFPTDYHSDYQWWDAMSHSGAIELSNFPKEITPIVRVIDDWFTNRPLALAFEVKVGKGKLLVSGIDFSQEINKRVEAQQLLYSLKSYMLGDRFNPQVSLNDEQLQLLHASAK